MALKRLLKCNDEVAHGTLQAAKKSIEKNRLKTLEATLGQDVIQRLITVWCNTNTMKMLYYR